MSLMQASAKADRRALNMRAKHQRILCTASALFGERGFGHVTVQEIADGADVAAGTLFRYASSKAELLLMVYNEQLREAIESATAAGSVPRDPVLGVCAMIAPVIEAASRHPGNATDYQRELMFGDPSARYRAEGLDLVDRLQDAIARLLVDCVGPLSDETESLLSAARRAARSVFAVLHLLLAQPSTAADWGRDSQGELCAHIAQIIAGFFAGLPNRAVPTELDEKGCQ